jgi:hypothetical protein
MRVPTLKPDNDSLGRWNAYVGDGKTKDIQLARYAEAPDSIKKQVASHMRLVVKLKEIRK